MEIHFGGTEAVPLTEDFAGTSKSPMWWQGRIYFVSDRDGTMNLWSMDPAGKDLQQVTSHKGWDVKSPSISEGRIVYQLGADLHLYDLAVEDRPADTDHAGFRLRPGTGEMGEEADRLFDGRASGAGRRTGSADGARARCL